MGEKKPDNIWIFLVAVVLPNAGGLVGASLWQDRDWFENEVTHPSWRPPNWLFPVAWTLIYSLMGIGSYYVWKHGEGKNLWIALGVYCVQLILNWFWTPFFFVWHLLLWSLVVIVILWVLIALTIYVFYRVNVKAACFLIPYIAWVTVATGLNSHYYHLNKDL
ncbi:tryptophan-rich sensory protein-like [Neodiprion pinetum]|uniref:Tryptophan-rich sensory protein n=1 Tax=Neodiprion lecontei TaxID=441921 RepID=A0A6J0BZ74_NEOLC|nr:tryptophan-rich sensory protein [Neodiprion lecontei]XP_046481260.1 tryptophan-rich sensory protein-like [Neodiprion pinetum]